MHQPDLAQFCQALLNTDGDTGLVDFCRKYILHGTPHVFSGREDQFYDFRKRIAVKYDVYYHEVYITGSAKLGFSPVKETIFSYDSDIDVAIVSMSLFDHFMEYVREYQMELRKGRQSLDTREINQYHKFLEYTAMGWIRPDKLPLSFRIGDMKKDWFNFFDSLSNGRSEVGNYKVSGGVYKTYRHLEAYTVTSMRDVKLRLEVGRAK